MSPSVLSATEPKLENCIFGNLRLVSLTNNLKDTFGSFG